MNLLILKIMATYVALVVLIFGTLLAVVDYTAYRFTGNCEHCFILDLEDYNEPLYPDVITTDEELDMFLEEYHGSN